MEAKRFLDDKFKVGPLPTVFYIPNFITDFEQSQLIKNIYDAPVAKWKSLSNRRLQNWGGIVHPKGLLPQDLPDWLTKLTCRISEESGLFPSAINHVLINEYLPNQGIMPHQDGPAYFPVVAIISIGSPVVMDFTPHSRLISCSDAKGYTIEGGHVHEGSSESEAAKSSNLHHPFSVLLMPRSLLIFKDQAYSEYLHGIKDADVQEYGEAVNVMEALHNHIDQPATNMGEGREVIKFGQLKSIHRTTTRISLTCRSVLKVHKNLFQF